MHAMRVIVKNSAPIPRVKCIDQSLGSETQGLRG